MVMEVDTNDDDVGDNIFEDSILDEVMHDIDNIASQIDQKQSLEDILNDTDFPDIESLHSVSENNNVHTPKKNIAIPAGGIDDIISVRSFDSKSGRRSLGSSGGGGGVRDHQKSEFGSIMRHVVLKAVTSQLTSAVERLHAGQPTCMTTTHLIAIGTQHGFILVFDSSQVIKWFLGGIEIGKNYGAVSSLAFSTDSARLLAGFARGQLMEFDIVTGRVVRDMAEVHPPGSAVTMGRYSDDPNTAFLADSGGSVFELTMKRGLRGPTASAKCIFSGSRGEVGDFFQILKFISMANSKCKLDLRYYIVKLR